MARAPHTHGVLLVDKPGGCTSHDVVAWARRAIGQREVGHAGTLDPMATGLLVVLLGEATKLSSYLTAASKEYLATVRFGAETDTLDAEGTVVARTDAPAPGREAIAHALEAMRGPMAQVPPAVSAIKQGGVALHERVRRGETVTPEAREVVLEGAELCAVRAGECALRVRCSKGFYVRSFARDLAQRLGTLGYLTALRRTRSGRFEVGEALDGAVLARAAGRRSAGTVAGEGEGEVVDLEVERARVRAAVLPLERAAVRALPVVDVEPASAVALGHGRPVAWSGGDEAAVLVREAESGRVVCVAALRDGVLTVLRGFRT